MIGAGPAGCAAAHELRRAGRDVIVLEQAPFIGGRTHTHRDAGVIVDSGAALVTSFDRTILHYARSLGLDRDLVRVDERIAVVAGDRKTVLRPGTASGLVALPGCSWRDKLKLVWFVLKLAMRRRGFDLSSAAALARDDTISVAVRARAELGETLYQVFVRPSIEAFWYASCEELSQAMMLALYARGAGARLLRFRGGMDGLCRALLGDTAPRLGCAVSELAAKPGGGFAVTCSGDAQPIDVEELVIATPAPCARRLIGSLPLSLVGDAQRALLGSQRYASSIHALFRIPRAARRTERAVMPTSWAADPAVVAIVFDPMEDASARTGGYVSVYLSAAASAELIARGGDHQPARCWELARELDPSLPRDAEPVALFDRAEAIPIASVGRFKLASDFQRAQRGPVVFAGDYLAAATVDGALRTGQHAAAVLLG